MSHRTKARRTTKLGLIFGLMFSSVIGWSTGGDLLSFDEAHAVVGRPLTPVSYAGVARRTARRTTARTVAVAGAYTATAAATLAVLPAGCVRQTVSGAIFYDCAGARYRPVYDGPEVVYVAVD